jgi:hypothetical protein
MTALRWQHLARSIRTLVPAFVLVVPVAAQWINYSVRGTPRDKSGKPKLIAPTPRTRSGKPDLSGIWESLAPDDGTAPVALGDTTTEDLNVFDLQNFMPKGTGIPMRPEAEALFQQRLNGLGATRPSAHCLPHGIPDAMLIPADFKIVQTPGVTLILYEEFNHYRQVFTDGRPHPADRNPAWFGYSIGKWEGDTFVVDTVGFNDRSWLDDHGHPHTDALHTTERFRRPDFGHMELRLTIDDPKAYTAPWSATVHFRLLPDTDLIESICENEKDAQHEVVK